MGCLVPYFNKRKRSDHALASTHRTPVSDPPNFHPSESHVSKKTNFSAQKLGPFPSLSQTRDLPTLSKSKPSSFSIISRYPAPGSSFPRQVHAPARSSKFKVRESSGSFWAGAVYGGNSLGKMGNLFGKEKILKEKYNRAKEDAIGSLRFLKIDKEVIELDDETEKGGSEDSSVEEVEILDHGYGKERQSVSTKKHDRVKVVEDLQKTDRDSIDGHFQPLNSSVVADLNSMKVDSEERVLDLTSVSHEMDTSDVPVHKKLLDTAKKRNGVLKKLGVDIKFLVTRLQDFQILRSRKKDVLREPFVPLSEEEEAEVASALSTRNQRKVLVTHENSNIDITGEVLQCLRPHAWLNDEVINLYLDLLKEREKRDPQKFLKCHFFNTFFYKKLIGGRGGYNYQSVRRWTTQRKLGYFLLDCDKIFVPIHKEVHWCLAVINKKDKKFQYLDSLGGHDTQVLKALSRYFVDEVKDKSGKDIDVSSWEQEFVEDLPEQQNGYDCGMFMIKYVDFYSRDIGLCFKQEHMPYFRLRTAKEILNWKAD